MGESKQASKSSEPCFWAVIPAAGVGKRMQQEGQGKKDSTPKIPKQYFNIHGVTILEHTLSKILQIEKISRVVVSLASHDEWWPGLDSTITDQVICATGGEQRANSVLNGLLAIEDKASENDWILVHDVVRPCVSLEEINRLISAIENEIAGGLLAVQVSDTLKKVSNEQIVLTTVPRQDYWLAATPQMFRYGMLRNALETALQDSIEITDEAHAMEYAGHSVKVVQGSADNMKITQPEDLFLAEKILSKQAVK